MSVNYRVVVKDPNGNNARTLDKVLSIQAARSVNTVGAASIVLPDTFDPGYWQRDMRFEFWRSTDNGAPYLLGDTVWFARRFVWMVDQKQWSIQMFDTNDLINRRIVAYLSETSFADKIVDWGTDDPADNLIKEYIRENLGADVENPFRDLSAYIEVEADRSLSVVTEKEGSFQDLFGVIVDICNDGDQQGGRLFFTLDPLSNGKFIFRVKKDVLGTDRTLGNAPIVFGSGYNNLTSIELDWDYTEEKNVVYAAGDGEGAGRLWVAVSDVSRTRRSPFNRQEVFIDMNDQDDENLLRAAARAELAKRKPKLRMTGQTIDTNSVKFGRDYFYGDKVAAVVKGFRFDCLVDAFSINYQEGGETDLTIRLNGDLEI